MKAFLIKRWWLLLVAPLLMQNVCGKHDDGIDISLPNADEYVTSNTTVVNGNLTSPADSLGVFRTGNRTSLYGMSRPTATTYIEISFDGPQQNGNYLATNFVVVAGGKRYFPAPTPVQVNVTSYGSIGQYIVGVYSGNAKDSATSAIVPVSGFFRIKNK